MDLLTSSLNSSTNVSYEDVMESYESLDGLFMLNRHAIDLVASVESLGEVDGKIVVSTESKPVLDHAVWIVNQLKENHGISLEGIEFNNVSVENAKNSIKKIWQAISEAAEALFSRISYYFFSMINGLEKDRSRMVELKKRAESFQPTAQPRASTVFVGEVLASISRGNKLLEMDKINKSMGRLLDLEFKVPIRVRDIAMELNTSSIENKSIDVNLSKDLVVSVRDCFYKPLYGVNQVKKPEWTQNESFEYYNALTLPGNKNIVLSVLAGEAKTALEEDGSINLNFVRNLAGEKVLRVVPNPKLKHSGNLTALTQAEIVKYCEETIDILDDAIQRSLRMRSDRAKYNNRIKATTSSKFDFSRAVPLVFNTLNSALKFLMQFRVILDSEFVKTNHDYASGMAKYIEESITNLKPI